MSQNQYQSNPYSQPYSQAPAAEAGYGYGGNAGYGQVSTGRAPTRRFVADANSGSD